MNNIPKILHLYWDRSPMSWLQTLTVFSFHKYNPDWLINVYIPNKKYVGNESYIPNYIGEDYFHLIEKSGIVNIINIDLSTYGIDHRLHNILRSDILRYHLLYNIGGVWSDFDVLWLRPMEHFRNIEYYGDTPIEDVKAVVSFINETSGGHSIGVMIHARGDEYIKSLIELTKKVEPPYNHEVYGSVMITREYQTLKSLSKFEGVIGVRFETYYPYVIHPPNPTIHHLYYENNLKCINNNVMCVHWYNGHVFSKEYINRGRVITKCSMSYILKKEEYVYDTGGGQLLRYFDDHLLRIKEMPKETTPEVIPAAILEIVPTYVVADSIEEELLWALLKKLLQSPLMMTSPDNQKLLLLLLKEFIEKVELEIVPEVVPPEIIYVTNEGTYIVTDPLDDDIPGQPKTISITDEGTYIVMDPIEEEIVEEETIEEEIEEIIKEESIVKEEDPEDNREAVYVPKTSWLNKLIAKIKGEG